MINLRNTAIDPAAGGNVRYFYGDGAATLYLYDGFPAALVYANPPEGAPAVFDTMGHDYEVIAGRVQGDQFIPEENEQ